jgi:hypothetical protein
MNARSTTKRRSSRNRRSQQKKLQQEQNKQLTQLQKDFNLTKQSKILTRHTNRSGKKTTTHTNHPLHPDFYALKNHRPLYSPNPQIPPQRRKTKKTKGPPGPGWGKPLQGQTPDRPIGIAAAQNDLNTNSHTNPQPNSKRNRVIAILSKLSPIGCNLTKTTKLACSTHVQPRRLNC